MPDTTTKPATKAELDKAIAAATEVCERLPEGEPRENALAHIRTTARWASRAIDEG